RDAARRALRRARLANSLADAAVAARRVGRPWPDDPLHHARRRRSDLPLGPGARDVRAPGPHPCELRDRARPAARLRAPYLRRLYRAQEGDPEPDLLRDAEAAGARGRRGVTPARLRGSLQILLPLLLP